MTKQEKKEQKALARLLVGKEVPWRYSTGRMTTGWIEKVDARESRAVIRTPEGAQWEMAIECLPLRSIEDDLVERSQWRGMEGTLRRWWYKLTR